MPTRRRTAADPRQLWLSLGDMPQEPAGASQDSVFFAAVPDPVTAARIAEFAIRQRRQHGLAGSLRPILHVSLLALGKYKDLSSEIIDRAKRAASTIEFARFVVAFDRVLSFKQNENRPFVLCGEEGVVGLADLREALYAAMADARLDLGALPAFKPHMTLLYDRKSVPELFLDEPLTWTVDDFVLVHSRHGEGRYEYLGQWALRGLHSER